MFVEYTRVVYVLLANRCFTARVICIKALGDDQRLTVNFFFHPGQDFIGKVDRILMQNIKSARVFNELAAMDVPRGD